ncbi:MAG: hypothetical protein IJ328_06835 [Muribaculaceae bacterium]|nr:hypothetical protein [Muribaculaceae bacterium]
MAGVQSTVAFFTLQPLIVDAIASPAITAVLNVPSTTAFSTLMFFTEPTKTEPKRPTAFSPLALRLLIV